MPSPSSVPTVFETALPLVNPRRGKVRDLYDTTLADGTEALALVATDRISAFDVVLPTPIPEKGVVLTQISRFWFRWLAEQLETPPRAHLISTDPADLPGLSAADQARLTGRVMIGRKTNVVPIECVVRGYLAGSGFKEYQAHGTVCGIALPDGLREGDPLPEPIFTPATKAETGHDENISFAQAVSIAGEEVMEKLRAWSLRIYDAARSYGAERGILIADTKFEFGFAAEDPDTPLLVDEVLTPDSSRFWPAEQHVPGQPQPSFDKQFVRDYLQRLVDTGQWDKADPAPELPAEIVQQTRSKYRQALHQLADTTPEDAAD